MFGRFTLFSFLCIAKSANLLYKGIRLTKNRRKHLLTWFQTILLLR